MYFFLNFHSKYGVTSQGYKDLRALRFNLRALLSYINNNNNNNNIEERKKYQCLRLPEPGTVVESCMEEEECQ